VPQTELATAYKALKKEKEQLSTECAPHSSTRSPILSGRIQNHLGENIWLMLQNWVCALTLIRKPNLKLADRVRSTRERENKISGKSKQYRVCYCCRITGKYTNSYRYFLDKQDGIATGYFYILVYLRWIRQYNPESSFFGKNIMWARTVLTLSS
jgi:hypothetical protein